MNGRKEKKEKEIGKGKKKQKKKRDLKSKIRLDTPDFQIKIKGFQSPRSSGI